MANGKSNCSDGFVCQLHSTKVGAFFASTPFTVILVLSVTRFVSRTDPSTA